jgi:hypothetical protein
VTPTEAVERATSGAKGVVASAAALPTPAVTTTEIKPKIDNFTPTELREDADAVATAHSWPAATTKDKHKLLSFAFTETRVLHIIREIFWEFLLSSARRLNFCYSSTDYGLPSSCFSAPTNPMKVPPNPMIEPKISSFQSCNIMCAS